MKSGHDRIDRREFLLDYPKMAIRPAAGTYLRLKGTFEFVAKHRDHGEVRGAYDLQIDVPREFPRELPVVYELGSKIPRSGDFHVNADASLCLGSHLRLLLTLSKFPTLVGFAETCIVPYLYAVTVKLERGGRLVFGELDHYGKGMLADYAALFGLRTNQQAKYAIQLLGKKKREANRCPCPCECGRRLGKCKLRLRLLRFRRLTSKRWFKQQLYLAG